MLVLFRWWKQSWIIGSFLRLSSWSKLFWICRPTRRPLPMLINQFRFASSFSDKKPSFLLHHSLENMIKEPFWKLTQSRCLKITQKCLIFEFSRQKFASVTFQNIWIFALKIKMMQVHFCPILAWKFKYETFLFAFQTLCVVAAKIAYYSRWS